MKHLRSILSFALCLALCLALGCGAFASGEPSGEASGETVAVNVQIDPVNTAGGEMTIDSQVILSTGSSAIQNAGDSDLTVRNSYIVGSTTALTEPLTGNPGNLLVAGSIRTTLAIGHAHSYYVNSTIVSQNWAALSTDAAEPALEEGEEELSLYAYNTVAITADGGYGAYSDLFCNLFSYGSHIQAAEIGIISGTYGRVVVGTIADGETDAAMAAHLTEADKAAQPNKDLGSVISGGRNAIMIHSVNLPPYWAYEGYAQDELPLYATDVTVNGSTLATDLTLDQGVAYDAQKQAYIDHTAGSVILIKSTNTDIQLTDSVLSADPKGTGAILHSVYNNDTMFMNTVPDGVTYPGMAITMTDMDVTGDVIDEDYQRDMYLTLAGSTLTGAVNYYDCAHWNEVAQAEGFTNYALDAAYETVHGTHLALTDGSVWNVTAQSTLLGLTIDGTSSVNGTMTVDGVQTAPVPGVYEGVIVLTPAASSSLAS